MRYRWDYLVMFLLFLSLLIIFVFKILGEISYEQHISNLIKHGVYAEGMLVQELTGTPSGKFFKGEYEARSLKYDFIINDDENRLRLYDLVTIIYDRKDPSDFVIEGDYNSKGLFYTILSFIFGLLVLISICSFALYQFIKIGKLLNNGKRVLCEPIKYKINWLFGSASAMVICKAPGDDSKIYKGTCYMNFEYKMKNNNLKYIPVYISQNNKNFYYANCEEVVLLIKRRNYNGHRVEELQGL